MAIDEDLHEPLGDRMKISAIGEDLTNEKCAIGKREARRGDGLVVFVLDRLIVWIYPNKNSNNWFLKFFGKKKKEMEIMAVLVVCSAS